MQSAVALNTDQEIQPALPLRAHTIFGVCEAIGEDFGFNPVFLRVPLATAVIWNPMIAFGTYFALGAVVLASRLLFPDLRSTAADAQVQPVSAQANEAANAEKVPMAA
jgi:phage shock protein PspC (stress-responsive transcriptional regulator)